MDFNETWLSNTHYVSERCWKVVKVRGGLRSRLQRDEIHFRGKSIIRFDSVASRVTCSIADDANVF